MDGGTDLLPRPSDRPPRIRRLVRGRASCGGHTDPARAVPAFRRDDDCAERTPAASDGRASGPSPKFLTGELGILDLDAGRYVSSCSGVVPVRVQEHIKKEVGLSGGASSPTSLVRRTPTRTTWSRRALPDGVPPRPQCRGEARAWRAFVPLPVPVGPAARTRPAPDR